MSQPPQPSRDAARSYLAQMAPALRAAHAGTKVPSTALVWPHGLDRSILHSLRISVRTRNCLQRAKLMEGDTPLKAADLLDLPHFGRNSLTDLLFNLERVLLDHGRNADPPSVSAQPKQTWAVANILSMRGHLAQIGQALRAAHAGTKVPSAALVWPDGLDRSILHSLPISIRTHNCLQRAKLMEGNAPLRAADLLDLPNFGRTSLTDLLFNLEEFLLDCGWSANTLSLHPPLSTEGASDLGSASASATIPSGAEVSAWNRVVGILRPLLATSAQLIGTRTLSDVLHPELLRLAECMKLSPELDAVSVREMVGRAHGLPALVAARLHRILEAIPERQRAVVQTRLIQAPPATLDEVGLQLDVTRERVRQIQIKLECRIKEALGEELLVVAAMLKDQLDPIVPERELERRIEGVVPNESPMVHGLFRKALISGMGFTLSNEVYIDGRARAALREIRTRAQAHADDVGLVDERQLIEILPDKGWRRFWPLLRELSSLHDLHGTPALRASAKARVKAALLSIGRPATREEIAARCGFDDSRTVGSTLSNIPSVVRADRERWGLREWIDDEYDGIVGEILQRIEEDGGATTTERLLTELPSKFNVSPASVRAYMQTPRFEIRNGSIGLASASAVQFRHLDDVIHGRDENDAPYWTFLVESRHLEGHSVTGVPPEFAKALGCSPESGLKVRIDNLPDCRELSLRWRLASLTGASLGYLSEPLRQLGLQPGDRARVTITGMHSVKLGAQDASAEARRPSEADAILEHILRRRRAL